MHSQTHVPFFGFPCQEKSQRIWTRRPAAWDASDQPLLKYATLVSSSASSLQLYHTDELLSFGDVRQLPEGGFLLNHALQPPADTHEGLSLTVPLPFRHRLVSFHMPLQQPAKIPLRVSHPGEPQEDELIGSVKREKGTLRCDRFIFVT